LWGNKGAYHRVFTCVFPTKFERNRWLSHLRAKLSANVLRHQGSRDGFTPSKQGPKVALTDFQRLLTDQPSTHRPWVIKVDPPTADDANEKVRHILNLGAVNRRFIDHKKKIYETSTRKIMSLTDLRNMPDVESSKTFVAMQYNEEVDDEKILCFMNESKDEPAKPTKPALTIKRK